MHRILTKGWSLADTHYEQFCGDPPFAAGVDYAGGSATAEWTAISGAGDHLQYRTNIGEVNWADLAGDVVAGGSTAAKTDTTPGTNTTRLHHVFVLP